MVQMRLGFSFNDLPTRLTGISLSTKHHAVGLKKHRESTAFSCPGYGYLLDSARSGANTRHFTVNVAGVLEEVQVSPLAFNGIMNRRRGAILGIGKFGPFSNPMSIRRIFLLFSSAKSTSLSFQGNCKPKAREKSSLLFNGISSFNC